MTTVKSIEIFENRLNFRKDLVDDDLNEHSQNNTGFSYKINHFIVETQMNE